MATSAVTKTKPMSPLQMVMAAIASLGDKKGSSSQAIKKYIKDNFNFDVEQKAKLIRNALNSGVDKGKLIRTKGKGAAGTFKLDTTKEKADAKAKAIKEKEKVKAKKEKERVKNAELKAKNAEKAKKRH